MQSLIYIGCGTLLFGALLLSMGIRSGIRCGVSEAEAFLVVLRRLREGMSCYLKTPAEALEGFESDSLLKIGFLPVGEEGIGFAFSRSVGRSHMSKEIKDMLEECFLGLGDGYLEDELVRLDSCMARLEGLIAKESSEGLRRGKVLTVVFTAAAMLVAILTI